MLALLDIANSLNVFGAVEDLLNRILRRDTGWTFRVPRAYHRRGAEIVGMWRRYGIASWGLSITGTHLIFHVKRRQARWAEYLLCRAGMPPDGPFYHPGNMRVHPGQLPAPWRQ